ncbi:zinc-binding metallopeptidase family protein [Aureimonas frigidaquae]|uniref:hypothetical protein n=1 Tax=Aureimonas frigidaquae TaxID=424757 RepID=UPI0007826643|nr:hypothetical protein [Aureimonas frigidaquae]
MNTDERTIMSMFSYMRPTESKHEQLFVDRFLTPLGFKRDRFQNLFLQIGDNPNILWSSHVDTVHRHDGIQTMHYDGQALSLSKNAKKRSTCLGADCTAGVWLMTEMVRHKIPGVYMIHHAEESGCVGSSALAEDCPEFFTGIEAAIAFDRMGYRSVVTHQCGGKTASDNFAWSLAHALDLDYQPDDGGVYTDTNEYAELVPECTNISVGYFNQHTQGEVQDVQFLIQLRDQLLKADFSNLVIERKPGDNGFTSYRWRRPKSTTPIFADYDGMEGYCRAYPELAAQLLEAYGCSERDFADNLYDLYGEVA